MVRKPKPNKNESNFYVYFNIISWIFPTINILMAYYYDDDIFHQVTTIGLDVLISHQIFGA